ncbi:Utp13 protein [Saccharomycopsis crataegensis]|uniref:Utp13 protein n=1 Tax=Saccharomycopsis crataegensis TaxID=43959 RepID=A0AAV5QVJ0_9ASCO|nr:Utp13 protein [Saccharomycopsis crataegensis]
MSSSSVSYNNTEIQPFYIGNAFASISQDGELLASAINEEIVLSNLPQGEIVAKLPGDGEDITALQLTPNGGHLAILSASQQLQIYNVEASTVTHSLKLSSPVYSTAVDQTSTLFALGGTDGLIQVWDIDNGYITHSFKGHSGIISCLKFYGELNSNRWYLVSGDVTGTIKVWDLVKRKCIATLNEHNSPVRGLEISPDLKYLVSGGRDNIINVFEITTKSQGNLGFKVVKSIPTNQSIEQCGFVSQVGNEKESNGYYIFFGGDGCYLQIYDFLNNMLIGASQMPIETTEELSINQIIKISDSRMVLVLSDQTIQIINLQTDATLNEDHKYSFTVSKTYGGNHGIVADISFVGPDRDLVALATNSPALRIIRPFGNQFEMETLEGHTDVLNSLDVSEDGQWILTGSKDNDARLWKFDETSFRCVAIFQGHASSVSSVSMSRVYNGKQPTFIITASSDLTIKKWDIPKIKDIEELMDQPLIIKNSKYTRKAHEKDINSVDLSPNDEFFATASYDKTAKIWDCATGETVGILKGHKRGLWKIKFCPFDKLVLTCSGDKTLKLWSLETYQCVRTFEGHSNSVLDCEFVNRREILANDVMSSNLDVNFNRATNNEIISCGADGLIKLWNLKSGEIIKTLDDHIDKIWCMSSKNNGEWFISADNEGMINLWKDNTLEVMKENQKNAKQVVEQQQSLENYIRLKQWQKAFKLALKLNHPMRLYNVLRSSIEEANGGSSFLGSGELDQCIEDLSDEELKSVFEKLRSWNVNFKFFEISQKLLKCIFHYHPVDKLTEIPGLMKVIEAVIPYNVRHYQRIDSLLEDSYILDYTIQEMNKLVI